MQWPRWARWRRRWRRPSLCTRRVAPLLRPAARAALADLPATILPQRPPQATRAALLAQKQAEFAAALETQRAAAAREADAHAAQLAQRLVDLRAQLDAKSQSL